MGLLVFLLVLLVLLLVVKFVFWATVGLIGFGPALIVLVLLVILYVNRGRSV